jgi:hypothetical protein
MIGDKRIEAWGNSFWLWLVIWTFPFFLFSVPVYKLQAIFLNWARVKFFSPEKIKKNYD